MPLNMVKWKKEQVMVADTMIVVLWSTLSGRILMMNMMSLDVERKRRRILLKRKRLQTKQMMWMIMEKKRKRKMMMMMMETFPSMTSVAGEMMMIRKVKTKKKVRKSKRKTIEEEMKQDNVQNLARNPVHHHTNVQKTTIQILGHRVAILGQVLQQQIQTGTTVTGPGKPGGNGYSQGRYPCWFYTEAYPI
ncbi:hypothetical protein L798_13225 [Zootermopsis nevadensis]|uniref:Uncharacterized protein n=1 Tax=Zootermopsis nevadensis TaxID=136037 RepID=A0A067R279_ZOONE|nr:hypothetical protein L798_13225 [Zootermopsis nevadensis]